MPRGYASKKSNINMGFKPANAGDAGVASVLSPIIMGSKSHLGHVSLEFARKASPHPRLHANTRCRGLGVLKELRILTGQEKTVVTD